MFISKSLHHAILCFVFFFVSYQAFVKAGFIPFSIHTHDHLAIAWQYPGQELEVVPATYSQVTRPGWPVTCSNGLDCDDGVWCNGK